MFYIKPGDDSDRGNKKAALERLDNPDNFNRGFFQNNLNRVAISSFLEITDEALNRGDIRAYNAAVDLVKQDGEYIQSLLENSPEDTKGKRQPNHRTERSYELLPQLVVQAVEHKLDNGQDDALKSLLKSCKDHPMLAISLAKGIDQCEALKFNSAQREQLAGLKQKFLDDHPEVENYLGGKMLEQLDPDILQLECASYIKECSENALKTGNKENLQMIIDELQPDDSDRLNPYILQEILSHSLKTGDTSHLHHLGVYLKDGTKSPLESMLETVNRYDKDENLYSPHLEAVREEITAVHLEKRRAVPFFRCQDMLDEEEFNPSEFAENYTKVEGNRLKYVVEKVAEKSHKQAIEVLVKGDSEFIVEAIAQQANKSQDLECVKLCQDVSAGNVELEERVNTAIIRSLDPVTPEFAELRQKATREDSLERYSPSKRVSGALGVERLYRVKYEPTAEQFKDDLEQTPIEDVRKVALKAVESTNGPSQYFDELLKHEPSDQERADTYFAEQDAEYKHALGKKAVEASTVDGKLDRLQSVLGALGTDENVRNGIQEGLAEYNQAKRAKEAQRLDTQGKIQALEDQISEKDDYISGKSMKFVERIAFQFGFKDDEVNAIARQKKSCKYELSEQKKEFAKLEPTEEELERDANHQAANGAVDTFYEELGKGPMSIERDYG